MKILVDWATSLECRRKGLLAHFGEKYEKQNCGMCDNCRKTKKERVNLTEAAQKFLSGVHRTNQRFGETHIISILLGSMAQKVVRNKHDELPTHGVGKEYSKVQWKNLAQQFLQHKLLKRDAQHGNLHLTPKGREVLKGSRKFWGFPVESIDRPTSELKPTHSQVENSIEALKTSEPVSEEPILDTQELFERLCDKRKVVAAREKLPLYYIVSNKTLQEMVTQLPQSAETFRKIHHIGPVKAGKYADDFLPIIRTYCEEHRIDSAESETKTLNTNEVTSEVVNEYDQELFELLQNKCKVLAQAEGSGIFTNRTLKEMAAHLPQTKKEFRQIHGVGFVKTKKYADIFLKIVRDYCKKHRSEFSRNTTEAPNEYSPELFELLQTERNKIVETEGDRVYEAFHDKALRAMATYFPTSEESFIQISSVGPERFNKYADIFFPIIRAYCEEHRIDATETKTGNLNTNDTTSKKRDEYAHDLFEQLQDKCKTLEKAEQEGIFTDRMLREMATSFPRTSEAFAQIRGVSLRKMKKYADDFLPIICAYCEEHGID